jgi:hypothetical protein
LFSSSRRRPNPSSTSLPLLSSSGTLFSSSMVDDGASARVWPSPLETS